MVGFWTLVSRFHRFKARGRIESQSQLSRLDRPAGTGLYQSHQVKLRKRANLKEECPSTPPFESLVCSLVQGIYRAFPMQPKEETCCRYEVLSTNELLGLSEASNAQCHPIARPHSCNVIGVGCDRLHRSPTGWFSLARVRSISLWKVQPHRKATPS